MLLSTTDNFRQHILQSFGFSNIRCCSRVIDFPVRSVLQKTCCKE